MDEINEEFKRRLKQFCSSKTYNSDCLENLKSYYLNHQPVLEAAGQDTLLYQIVGHKVIEADPKKKNSHAMHKIQGRDQAREYRIQLGKTALGLR